MRRRAEVGRDGADRPAGWRREREERKKRDYEYKRIVALDCPH